MEEEWPDGEASRLYQEAELIENLLYAGEYVKAAIEATRHRHRLAQFSIALWNQKKEAK